MLFNGLENVVLSDTDVIYFILVHRNYPGGYPSSDPFPTWIHAEKGTYLTSDKFAKDNHLCVVIEERVDSTGFEETYFYISASKKWIDETCPLLLTQYRFLYGIQKENGKLYLTGKLTGIFNLFTEYNENDFGIKYIK